MSDSRTRPRAPAALLRAAALTLATAACGNSPATDGGGAGQPTHQVQLAPAPAHATPPEGPGAPAPAAPDTAPAAGDTAPAPGGQAAAGGQAAPRGPVASATARARAIETALIARGWTAGNFKVSQDGPDIGQWQTFMAFTTNPSGTLVDVWAGPAADRDPDQIVIAGQPLTRAQLRALVAQTTGLRDIARIVIRTAGKDSGLGDPETGSSKGAPGPLEGKLRAPAVDRRPGGDAFVFDARTLAGGYARVTVPLSGDGPVTLDIAPIP